MLQIVGVILFVAGIPLMLVFMKSGRKYIEIRRTSTVTVAEAMKRAKESGKAKVELEGTVKLVEHLMSAATKTPCIYYRHKVRGNYEYNTVATGDGYVPKYARTERRWLTELDRELSVPFLLDDGSDQIMVDPDGAKCIAEQTLDWEKGAKGFSPMSKVGGTLKERTRELLSKGGSGERLLGRQTSEWVIPPDKQVYILGNVTRTEDGTKVGKGKGKFIISIKPEKELIKEYQTGFILFTVGCVICPVGFLIMLLSVL